jgi:hypothetical protein
MRVLLRNIKVFNMLLNDDGKTVAAMDMLKGSPFSEAELSVWNLSQEEDDGFSKDDNNSLNPQDSSTTITY